MRSHFIIITNHRNLKNLLTQTIQIPEQQTFLCKLFGFYFTIIYRPGKDNKVADALSRSSDENEEEEVIYSNSSKGETGSLFHLSTPILYPLLENLMQETEKNEKLQEQICKIKNGDNSLQNFKSHNGLIKFVGKLHLIPNSPIIPLVLNEFHDSMTRGHSRIKAP